MWRKDSPAGRPSKLLQELGFLGSPYGSLDHTPPPQHEGTNGLSGTLGQVKSRTFARAQGLTSIRLILQICDRNHTVSAWVKSRQPLEKLSVIAQAQRQERPTELSFNCLIADQF